MFQKRFSLSGHYYRPTSIIFRRSRPSVEFELDTTCDPTTTKNLNSDGGASFRQTRSPRTKRDSSDCRSSRPEVREGRRLSVTIHTTTVRRGGRSYSVGRRVLSAYRRRRENGFRARSCAGVRCLHSHTVTRRGTTTTTTATAVTNRRRRRTVRID